MNPVLRYTAAGALVLAVVGGALGGSYFLGKSHGEAVVSLKWSEEKRKRDQASLEIQEKNRTLEETNRRLSDQITKELEDHEKRTRQAVDAAVAEFAARLRTSEARAGIYRKQAEGGAAERERLASHAAELDQSLEEGRYLVRELGETIRLRDSQLRLIGQQLMADRSLLTESTD